MNSVTSCVICGTPTSAATLAEAGWVAPETAVRLAERKPGWRRSEGACPACVQDAILSLLLERGEGVLGTIVQAVWPLDAEAAFGALPTPLRMRADPRYTGRGVTVALVDAGFHPHADLVQPVNRVRAWADVGGDDVVERRFTADEVPRWPGSDRAEPHQWHGLMTSTTATGNGWMSRGLYRGMAPDADVLLVQARGADGRIGSARIARALRWLHDVREDLGVRVVSISLGGTVTHADAVHDGVAALVDDGVVVVAAAGNDGVRSLAPPASAPRALTVGGIDDRNVLDVEGRALWHGNYGDAAGRAKPELVAPSIWVAAPMLPDSDVVREAAVLFTRRAAGDADVEPRIAELRLVTPHYQHVEGTSFAAPIVAGTVACMLEAVPSLTPARIAELLARACHVVPGAPRERQGAGALDAGAAVRLALAAASSDESDSTAWPMICREAVRFRLRHAGALSVRVLGSWDGWRPPGLVARVSDGGAWDAVLPRLAPGTYAYKFLVDDAHWIADPACPRRASDGHGGWNSVFDVA